MRVAQHGLELADAGLLLALLLTSGVVAAVLGEVTLVAGLGDLAGDLGPAHGLEVLELGAQLVERLLGEPDGGLMICRHSSTLAGPPTQGAGMQRSTETDVARLNVLIVTFTVVSSCAPAGTASGTWPTVS